MEQRPEVPSQLGMAACLMMPRDELYVHLRTNTYTNKMHGVL